MADATATASSPAPGNDGHGSHGGAAGSDAGNKFQSAIAAWRNVDLTSLVSTLDNTASEIVAYQRDSTVQRKDLAQKTKDFRKMDDATKLSEIKGLLKAYQTFIDLLTNHSKSVNSAFIQTYNALSEAPDPYPLLEASVDSMLVAEDTLPKLTDENNHLQKSVTQLTSQLDETEAKLQTELAARKQLEDTLEGKIREVEQSWTSVLDEKKENWEAKEKAFEDKIETQDRLLSEIKASYEVNQRLGLAEEAGNEEGRRPYVTSAELEMVNSDLERTSARLADVEARNGQLLTELAQAKSAMPDLGKSIEDDPAYIQVLSQNSSLVRKLEAGRVEKEGLKRQLDTKLRGLEREVGSLRNERDTLKAKVQKWSDYEDVKQELEVLKSIEFSTGDDDEAGSDAAAGARGKGGDTLEQLLLARNKKLSEEATILRVSHQDLQARLTKLEEDLAQRNAEVERLQKLSEKLENDLSTVQAEAPNAFPSGASVAGTYVSRYAPTIGGRRAGGRSSSPTSSIISGFNPQYSGGGGNGGEAMGGGSGILPMITAQRDRFKKRITELEHELADERRVVSQLRQEVAALQRDNLNLYEKTRYMSSYNRGGSSGFGVSASSASAYASNPNPSTVTIGGGGGNGSGRSLDRYRKAYESNLSPFQAFRGRESARAYRRLSFPERVVYSITRMVLASRTSRNLFAAYCVALHLVVFLSLYWMSGMDGARHASNFGHDAAMAAAAGGGGTAAAAAPVGVDGSAAGGSSHGDWQEEGFSH
ncbi:hypothetical protein SCUCBS95973_000044 [Sporothrix curviconia]|uniref:Protein CASP n=1 Tax=Sporothrix curviconia TaxID=1260050 RepID=A0ABP0ALV9_9PEZI